MSIIYLISAITLYISFLLVKKSDKKLDLISWVGINLVILLCYNTFICYVFSTVNIPINLYSLSIINYILSAIFIAMIVKGKKQEYEFNKVDLIVVGIIILITTIFALWNFGFPLQVKYIMTDSAVHYYVTNLFGQSDTLLNKDGHYIMPGAYSNAGILVKVFSPYMEFVELYKVFVSFDIFMFFLTGFLMYIALKKVIKSKYEIFISTIITIIYMIGYPLNVMLFGFFYLQLGIIVFSTTVIMMQYFKEETIDSKCLILIMFLLCLELFFSYYLFVPVVYAALFVYYAIFFKKKYNKLINKKLVIYTLITLIIPFIIGFIYEILPGMKSVTEIQAVNQISLEGYIYRNVWSNVILFVPFALVYILKEKESDYNFILFSFLIIYMCLLYVGFLLKVVSSYYFHKTNFILWFLLIYLFARGIFGTIKYWKKGKIIVNLFIIVYIVLLIISLCAIDVQITKSVKTDESLYDVMEIYGLNKTILTQIETDYTLEEIEILKYVSDNIEITKDTDFLIFGEPKQEYWFWGIFGYKNREDPEIYIELEEVRKWNENEKYDYLICFNRTNTYKNYAQYINLDKELIFSNESGAIYKNK